MVPGTLWGIYFSCSGCRHPELPTRSRDLPVGLWGVVFSVGAATLVPLLGNNLPFHLIQASSQLNPDRDKIFKFSGQPSSNPKFSTANFAQQFRFGAQDYSTPDLNFLQNCFGDKSSIHNSPISTTIVHRGAHNISANSFSLRHIQTNKWSAHLAGFWSPVEQFCRHSHLSLDQLR